MPTSHLLDPLNDAQRAAVAAPLEPLLVLAGAGSGKTRVLVHRIAWLIQAEGVYPSAILAVTFTNKAAAEMRGRIEELLGMPLGGMWVGTFHGLAHRLLRLHWREADLPQSFQILDGDDQYRAIRRVLKGLELDEEKWPPRQAQGFINARKDEGQRAGGLNDGGDPHLRQMIRIYQVYEAMCQRAGVVDFAELLLRAFDLWRLQPEVLAQYQQRFRHILVDEFQDTNAIQYAWLRLLAGSQSKLFMVGDDDQSIYGWRGAKIENIHQFSRDFPGTNLLRLEQNYRSTGTILAAANAVIANNTGRLGKNLWTSGAPGAAIQLYNAHDEKDEARFVVERIRKWLAESQGRRADCAILYRSNAQSRAFEEVLLQVNMPYRIYGGLRFFERAEIKDALAYLRLTLNRQDDASFERVVNLPTRGIGDTTLDALRSHARQHEISMWQGAQQLLENQHFNARAGNAVSGFLRLIDGMALAMAGKPLHDQLDYCLKHSGLLAHFGKEKDEKGQGRLENLEELITAARDFQHTDEDLDVASGFLAHAALEAGEGQGNGPGTAWDDCVQLMSLHSAKGLEFPLVFLCGMEEGLFPHQMSSNDPVRLQEERRLCYVGMTRARQKLFLTHAECRRLHGKETHSVPSRFVCEIPAELIENVRMRGNVSRPGADFWANNQARRAPVTSPPPMLRQHTEIPPHLRLGQQVVHAKFGEGVVLNYEGQGEQARIQVNFRRAGSKWLMATLANLQAI